MTKLNKKDIYKIIEIVEDAYATIDDDMNESIEVEEFGSSTTVSSESYLYTMLEDVGQVIGIDLNLDLTKSIDDICNELSNKTFVPNIHDYEELVETDSWSDADSEPKYIYKYYIMKYKPNGTFHQFVVQTAGDVDISIRYDGEVKKEPVTTYRWV